MHKNIVSELQFVEDVFQATHIALDAMADGSRIQLKQLVKEVAVSTKLDPKKVFHFVNHFVHASELVYVTRGKNGGIVKGEKPAKVDKPVKTKKTVAVAADDDTTV